MEERGIIGAEILVHHSLVDNDLLSLLAIGSVVVELEGLDELVLAVGIPLISLNDWHATLIGLNDIHREIFDIILVVLGDQITFHSDHLLIVRVIFVRVVLSGEIEELLSWILGAVAHFFHIFFEALDGIATSGILRSFVTISKQRFFVVLHLNLVLITILTLYCGLDLRIP